MTVLMKRSRDDDTEVENFAMANYLILLSRLENNKKNNCQAPTFSGRVYRCRTCDREFQSFQALGGHRASHKKPKFFSSDLLIHSPEKAKIHDCSICGLDFAIGQALGGHMKRHRGAMAGKSVEETNMRSAPPAVMPVIRKSNSKRVLCLNLDLTLAPPENDLKLENHEFAGPFLQLGF